MPIRSRALSAALLTVVLVAGEMPAITAADAPPHVWRGQLAQPRPHIRWAGRAPGLRRAVPFGPAITGSRLRRVPAVTDGRTGKILSLASTNAISTLKLSGATIAAAGVRRTMDVSPPSSAACHDYGGDVWACDVVPGSSYDLPVSSTVDPLTAPTYCFNVSPVFYWRQPPPHGISVSLLSASGAQACGATWTGTVRVTLSTQAPWEDYGNPDFTFKLVYTACGAHAPADCTTGQNGFAQTGGTRYSFWTNAPPHGFPAIPERACGRCNGTTIGKPIDVATGEVWDEKSDLALSGPFGLSFTRFYGNQTAGSADLGGTNWLHTYAALLDVTSLSNGNITYWDNRGMPYYFSSVAKGGAAAYDNASGMSLALSSDGSTYTLTSFDARTWAFDAVGELLAMHDRVGNAQTVVRDAANANRIASVADSAGRQLCFYYDSANRIVGVAAWMSTAACPTSAPASSVTTPVVTLAYNTGVNCSANSLCAVTEPDGNAWTYQYTAADTTYPYNLSEALDPLADPEEINGFSGNRITHQETGSCTGASPCADTGGYVNIAYPASGSSTATITDGLGRTSSITYDPNTLLLTRISGPVCRCGGNQTRNYTYDSSQRLTSKSDDAIDGTVKHTTTFGYTRDAGVRTYPGPTSVTETIDTSGAMRTTSFAYYAVGDPRQDLPLTRTEPSIDNPAQSVVTTNTYSSTGLLTQRTTSGYVNQIATAYTRRWTYDSRGRLVSQTLPRTDVNATMTYQYFSDTATDAATAGQLRSVTDALGHSKQFAVVSGYASYTPFGDPQSVTDPNGVNTELAYDANGRLVSSMLLPAAEGDQTLATQMVYDTAGRMTQRILPARNSNYFRYDSSSRLGQIVTADAANALRERVTMTYNAFDQASSIAAQTCTTPSTTCGNWGPAAFTSSTAYSGTSTLAQVINGDNTAKTMTYTAQGKLATVNDENHTSGNDYRYTYDLAGRRLSETRVLASAAGGSATTQYAYDLDDNVISVTDTNHNVTTYHYDDFDRVTKQTSPVTGVTTYTYDADNNLASTVNANGATVVYTYDALDRMLTETDTKGSANASEAWTYDDATAGHFGIGRLATMTDPSGSTAYTYDRRGNIEVENHNIGGSLFTYGYSYDINGNRYEITYPDGTIVTYTYDFADRPYSAQQVAPTDPGMLSVTRRTHSISHLKAKGLAAPIHAAKSELPARRPRIPSIALPTGPAGAAGRPLGPPARGVQPPPSGNRLAAGAAALGRRAPSGTRPDTTLVSSATYAPFGPITSIAFGNGTTQTVTYDQRYFTRENKLVAASTTLADHQYTYDPAGNMLSNSDALDSGYARSYSYDDLNRVTTANSGSKLWGTGRGNGYTYDTMGNMTARILGTNSSTTFTYRSGAGGSTGLPLLQSVNLNGVTSNITYDAIGSMLGDGTSTYSYGARELLGSNGPSVQSYMYDGFRRRVQTQLPDGRQRFSFFDQDQHLLAESALGASSPAVAYDYIWFDDRPIAQLDGTGTSWTYADNLGTPLIETGANGSVTWQAEHEPYGSVWALRSGDIHQPLRLPGQTSEQFDAGTNGATSLSYNNARWYRPDLGRYTQADPIGLVGGSNLYAYVDDAPAMTTDFLGLRKRRKKDLTCQEMLEKIANLEDQVNDRFFDMVIDKLGQRYQPFYIPGDEFKPGTSRGGHINLMNKHSVAAQKLRQRYAEECQDDEPPGGSCPAHQPAMAPAPAANNDNAKNGAAAAATLVVIYWVVSEGTRLFPPRNFVPVL